MARVILLQIRRPLGKLHAAAVGTCEVVEFFAQPVHHFASATGRLGTRALADSADHPAENWLRSRRSRFEAPLQSDATLASDVGIVEIGSRRNVVRIARHLSPHSGLPRPFAHGKS